MPERSQMLTDLEEECKRKWIPLIEPEVAQLLQVLLSIKKPKKVLEIGTGIGYSSISMASCLQAAGVIITTIEIDQERYKRACNNFKSAGITEMMEPLLGDANEILSTLVGPYDFIFIDAAKGQYPEFFQKVIPLLADEGMIVMDNIFLNGWVIDMTWPERRKKTMVCRIRELLEELKDHSDFMTTVLPLGDGVSVSTRRRNSE